MTIYTQPNLTTGIDSVMVDVAGSVPSFIPMFLFFIFCTVLLGGMVAQRKRTGMADMPMWAVLASISTFMISLTLTLLSGLIDLPTLAIVTTITIFSGFWFFMDRNRNEIM